MTNAVNHFNLYNIYICCIHDFHYHKIEQKGSNNMKLLDFIYPSAPLFLFLVSAVCFLGSFFIGDVMIHTFHDDFLKMKVMYDIPIHDYIKTSWIGLSHIMTPDVLLTSVWLISVIKKKLLTYSCPPFTSRSGLGWTGSCEKSFRRFTQTGFVSYYML